MEKSYKILEKCPITGTTEKFTYFDLGDFPLVNNLCNTREESINCQKYPLAVQLFEKSGLSCLTVVVESDVMYQHYLYKSGVSQPYINHCKEMFEFVNTYVNLTENDTVLDIGGNDGTLLKAFLEKNPKIKVLNIDASENITKEASLNGIPSINAYWGFETAKSLNRKFRLITTTNCFQHTEQIDSFVKGISLCLEPFGIWCLEFPYRNKHIEAFQFDQVYHEHMYYYYLKPLQLLLDKHNLRIIKVVSREIHGGSVRVLITHKGKLGEAYQPCNSVEEFMKTEDLTFEDYIKWGEDSHKKIKEARDTILELKNKGYKIASFGAAAKGCVFLNAAGLTHEHIEYIIDDTDIKQNKYMPGTGIEIMNRNALITNPVDYIIILAHNFADHIIKSLDGVYRGKFIILLPETKIY